ncbi:uncharacterized protein LOC62_02G001862 [Vanrija pseudolonga]|uniref:Uncharacterized protein n=1 Tax=Vanrija pseudolonga TaxID=143232 RepID=A0AAF1BI36_9TREE|nr:hypothetical protein LOC62_02G001862 [Vanrija pseudolonga]
MSVAPLGPLQPAAAALALNNTIPVDIWSGIHLGVLDQVCKVWNGTATNLTQAEYDGAAPSPFRLPQNLTSATITHCRIPFNVSAADSYTPTDKYHMLGNALHAVPDPQIWEVWCQITVALPNGTVVGLPDPQVSAVSTYHGPMATNSKGEEVPAFMVTSSSSSTRANAAAPTHTPRRRLPHACR